MRHKISLGFNKSALLVARTLCCTEENREATARRKDPEQWPSHWPRLSDKMWEQQPAPLFPEHSPAALSLRHRGAGDTMLTTLKQLTPSQDRQVNTRW